MIGEEEATYLGVNVNRLKWIILSVNVVIVAVATAFTGVISFVGTHRARAEPSRNVFTLVLILDEVHRGSLGGAIEQLARSNSAYGTLRITHLRLCLMRSEPAIFCDVFECYRLTARANVARDNSRGNHYGCGESLVRRISQAPSRGSQKLDALRRSWAEF
jgi:hypothetical protein